MIACSRPRRRCGRCSRKTCTALIFTLEKGLGADFTPEVKAAWVETYELVSGVMKEAVATEPA